MIWGDIAIEDEKSIEELIKSISTAFDQNPSNVCASYEIEDIVHGHSIFLLLAENDGAKFKQTLTLYCNENINLISKIDKLKKISLLLKTKILTADDENHNPYAFEVFHPSGLFENITVDPIKLDDFGIFEIITMPHP